MASGHCRRALLALGVPWDFEENATFSFEGGLSQLGLAAIPGARTDESPVLHGHTKSPVQDFVVLPATRATTAEVKRCLSGIDLLDEARPLFHVQVQSGDGLVLGAYDNFDPECVVVWPPTPEALLRDLVAAGVVRSYDVAG